jgi:uncharacterized protein
MCIALFYTTYSTAQIAVPQLHDRVTDLTNTLTNDQIVALNAELREFEEKKGSQISVLIVPTTEPEPIEQYSIRVVEQWKVGRKNVDDGALLLVAKNDRTMRIEVGYGLEGALNDAVCKRIISDIITPQFKNGDFYAGVNAGIDAMINVVQGEPLPSVKGNSTSRDFDTGILPVAIIVALIVGNILRMMFGRLFGALVTGGVAGLLAWAFAGAVGAALLAGILAFIFTLLGGGFWGVGGFRMGGGQGSGYGGGFGGFSGGGGTFGGGGASGRW